MDVADTLTVMNEGRIEQSGSPREVYDRPATDFVMGFIGPVSRLDGRLVRPHDVTLTRETVAGSVQASVSRIVHLGFEVRVELTLPDGGTARAQVTRHEAEELALAPGDAVHVRLPTTEPA